MWARGLRERCEAFYSYLLVLENDVASRTFLCTNLFANTRQRIRIFRIRTYLYTHRYRLQMLLVERKEDYFSFILFFFLSFFPSSIFYLFIFSRRNEVYASEEGRRRGDATRVEAKQNCARRGVRQINFSNFSNFSNETRRKIKDEMSGTIEGGRRTEEKKEDQVKRREV